MDPRASLTSTSCEPLSHAVGAINDAEKTVKYSKKSSVFSCDAGGSFWDPGRVDVSTLCGPFSHAAGAIPGPAECAKRLNKILAKSGSGANFENFENFENFGFSKFF